MSAVYVYTSFTLSYLQKARILAKTLRSAHPNWVFCALITDEMPPNFDFNPYRHEFDHVIFSHYLDIPNYRSWIFKHDIIEACTAVKGRMLSSLLRGGAKKVIYLDPDIAVFHSLDDVERKLDNASIILTPHQTSPNHDPKEIEDNEMTTLQYGVYNLGFIAVRNDEVGLKFAEWWSERLDEACYDEPARGIFTDQKYCDLLPGLFDNVYVERDSGYNVASWNLSRRRISIKKDGAIYSNKSLLKFYHFTKINSIGDLMTERYARDNYEVFEIWNWYKRQIALSEVSSIPNRWWAYGVFENQVAIKKSAREIYRSSNELMRKFANPFAVGNGTYYEYLIEHHPELVPS